VAEKCEKCVDYARVLLQEGNNARASRYFRYRPVPFISMNFICSSYIKY
jgi:hypothetical protein